MLEKIRNVHKFKSNVVNAPKSNLDLYSGHIEFVGSPSVRSFIDWAIRTKQHGKICIGPSDTLSIEYNEDGLIDSLEGSLVESFLDHRVRTIDWAGSYGLCDYHITCTD